MDVNIIEQKLLSLDGGSFQKLCFSLFAKKYPNYVPQPNGGSIGNDKTTIGHPDFLLKRKDSAKFILVECTTKMNGLEDKMQGDVRCCLDEDITGIANDEIEEIVFCYSGKAIDNSVYSNLSHELKGKGINFNAYGIGAIATEIYNKYPSIASCFLGMHIPVSKCSFSLDEFIKESEENSLSPSLAKEFGFRNEELNEIEKLLKECHFILLSGNSGVGKTKLALEFAKRTSINPDQWVIFKASGNPNIDEIKEAAITHTHFIVDDFSSFENSISDIIQILRGKSVIATSRNYLVSDLESKLKSQNISYKVLDIKPLDDNDLKEIIKNNTELSGDECLNKIVEIAKGNPRIAFMAADESAKKGIGSLFNVKEVFANYYYDRIGLIENWGGRSNDPLKVIGLVCFLKKISIESIDEKMCFLKYLVYPKQILSIPLIFFIKMKSYLCFMVILSQFPING